MLRRILHDLQLRIRDNEPLIPIKLPNIDDDGLFLPPDLPEDGTDGFIPQEPESPNAPVIYEEPVPTPPAPTAPPVTPPVDDKTGETEEITESKPAVDETGNLTDEGSKIYGAAKENGVSDTAENAEKLKEYMETVTDEYIQKYLQNHPEITGKYKSDLIVKLKNAAAEFVNKYYTDNPDGSPYDTQKVAAAMMGSLDKAAATKDETSSSSAETDESEAASIIEKYKADTDKKFDDLAKFTDAADNDYVTASEFKDMKEKAIAYLLSTILNEKADTEFFKNMDSNYQNNTYYRAAMAAVADAKNASDPAEIQKLLTRAENALRNFLGTRNADGSSKLNDAVVKKAANIEKERAAAEEAKKAEEARKAAEAAKEKLILVNDEMMEKFATDTTDEKAVNERQELLTKILEKFMSEYKGDGKDVKSDYQKYANKIIEEQNAVNKEIRTVSGKLKFLSRSPLPEVFSSLTKLIDDAGAYISIAEKEKIYDEAAKFALISLLRGEKGNLNMSSIYPDYASDKNYIEAEKLLDGINSSLTPAEDLEKIKKLINEMIKNIDVKEIKSAVDKESSKNVNININDVSKGLWGYNNRDTFGGDDIIVTEYTINDGKIEWTQRNDKGDIQRTMSQLQEKLKSLLKEQLGDLYNESMIEECFNQAQIVAMLRMNNPRGKHTVGELTRAVLSAFNELTTAALHNNKTDASVKANYGDNSLTNGLDNLNARVNYKNYKVDPNGNVYLPNDSGNEYKEAMDELYSKLVEKYKAELGDKFDEESFKSFFKNAQSAALETFITNKELAWGGGRRGDKYITSISDIVRQTLYELDKIMLF